MIVLGRIGIHALIMALCAVAAAGAQTQADLFEQGVELYRQGDYRDAQRLLRNYVEANGERSGAPAIHLGEAYHYLGLMTADTRLAEGYFQAVAQRYPTAPVADESLARLAELYMAIDNLPEARKQWRALARDYPLSRFVPEVDLRVGQAHFAGGELEPAYEAFSSGFSKMKDYQRSGGQGANLRILEGEYVYWLGRTLMTRRAFGDARKYFNLVLLDYPNHPLEPLALYHLSESWREEGKEKEAASAWRRFSESVRNTSLEAVAENPNLVAVARARESGDLTPRALREEGAANDDAVPERPSEEGVVADSRRQPEVEGADSAERTEDMGLRAPEPGRPGGIVPKEPLGKRVEQPPPEPPREDARLGAQAAESERTTEGEPAAADDQAAAGDQAVESARTAEGELAAEDEPRSAEDAAREAQVLERAAEIAAADATRERVMRRQEAGGDEVRPDSILEYAGADATNRERSNEETAGDQMGSVERTPARFQPLLGVRDDPSPPAPKAPERPQARVLAEAGESPDSAPAAEPSAEAAETAGTSTSDGVPAESLSPGTVYLQAGAFTSAQSAAQLSSSLRKKGFEPAIHSGLVEGQGFYRVRFGPYEVPRDRTAMDATREALSKAGFDALVRRAGSAPIPP